MSSYRKIDFLESCEFSFSFPPDLSWHSFKVFNFNTLFESRKKELKMTYSLLCYRLHRRRERCLENCIFLCNSFWNGPYVGWFVWLIITGCVSLVCTMEYTETKKTYNSNLCRLSITLSSFLVFLPYVCLIFALFTQKSLCLIHTKFIQSLLLHVYMSSISNI